MNPINEKPQKLLFQMIIYFAIIALFWLLPPIGAITPEGMKLFGIFVAFIYGLTATSDVWPALITFVLFPLTGMVDFVGVLGYSFGNDTCFFVMLSLVLVAYMEESGAAAYIATWLLKRKILKGHPWRLLFMIFFICWLLSSFVNAIAGMMLTWAFLYQIFAQFNYKPFEKLPSLIMLGTCVVGGLGLSTLPWGNNSIVILNAFTNTTGLEVNYFLYMGYSIPYSLAVIALYLIMCRVLFKMDVQDLKSFNPETLSVESQVMNKEKGIAMLAMVALILIILIPTCFPATSLIATLSKQFGLSGKLLLIFAVVHMIRINGKSACNFVQMAKKGINWNLMMIVASIMVFSNLIGSDEAGINIFLGETLATFFVGKSHMVFIVTVAIVTVVCTNFMVNKIVAILMISMTMPIVQTLDIDPIQMVCLYTVISTVAFLLPSASQSATVLFSNSEWVRAADVFKYGMPLIFMMTILMIFWNLFYFSIF